MATREAHKVKESRGEAIRRAKGNTEAGMSQAQIATTRAWEESQRNRKTENLAVIGEDGTLNPLGDPVVSRSRSSVRSNPARIPENAIVTHNHPWDEKTDGIGLGARVGASLSDADIANAIRQNNKEKRAVTQNYIYSIKRPAGGWKANPNDVKADWDRVYKRETKAFSELNARRRSGELTYEEYDVRWGRVNALASHRATRYVADKYGFIYTRRKRT